MYVCVYHLCFVRRDPSGFGWASPFMGRMGTLVLSDMSECRYAFIIYVLRDAIPVVWDGLPRSWVGWALWFVCRYV